MNGHIIVIGANGMLGHVVVKELQQDYNVTGLTSAEFNILQAPLDTLSQYINDETICVINCAGIIKPRIKNHTVEEVFKINSWFPIMLSKYIDILNNDYTYNLNMIHISTDCVFTGKIGNYRSTDIPDAEDIYGMSKSLGEACMGDTTLVIRTSIIGEELNNKYSLLEWAKSQAGKEVQGWTNHIWSGVTTVQLAEYIRDLLNNSLDTNSYRDIVTYASEKINKYDLLKLINEVYDLNLTINACEGPSACDRSLVCDTWNPEDLKTQLKNLKEFFKNE